MRNDAREGPHSEICACALRNRTPRAAIESMLGVGGLTGERVKEVAAGLKSSAMMRSTLARGRSVGEAVGREVGLLVGRAVVGRVGGVGEFVDVGPVGAFVPGVGFNVCCGWSVGFGVGCGALSLSLLLSVG